MDLLAAKKECLDMVQEKIFREHAEIYRDPKQKVKEEASLPGKRSVCVSRVLLQFGK